MREAPDPLEAELSALRPHAVSLGLRWRVAERLAEVACPAFATSEAGSHEQSQAGPRKHATLLWRLALAGGLAAACLAAVLLWWAGSRRVESEQTVLAPPVTPKPLDDSPNFAALLEARRVLDEAETSTFRWPLEETSPMRVSTSIPPDLLDY